MKSRYTYMHTFLALVLIAVFMLHGAGAMELEKREGDGQAVPEEKALDAADTAQMNLLVDARLQCGGAYPVGEIETPDDSKRKPGLSMGGSIAGGYLFENGHAVMLGLSFHRTGYTIERPYMSQTIESEYHMQYIRMGLGYRFMFGLLFIEPGLYYGIHTQSIEEKQYVNGGHVQTNTIDGNNEPGMYLSAGVQYRVMKDVDVIGGITLEGAFMPAVENGNTLYTLGGSLFAGATYRFVR